MAKRPLIAVPPATPRPATPDAFVAAGQPAPMPKAPMKRLTIDIDAELHRAFKLKALQEGQDMKDVMTRAIEDYTRR